MSVGPSTAPAGRPVGAPAVRAVGLTCRFGAIRAVDSLDLEVATGTVFGLVGRNGAGKTTTLSVLATLLAPTRGRVEVLGLDPVTQAHELRGRIGYVPAEGGHYDGVTVGEYLGFYTGAYHLPRSARSQRVDELLAVVGLDDRRDSPVGALSRGMQQRLDVARALVHDPELLVLDEPASGLDPRGRVQLRRLLGALRAQGRTIVVSSHVLSDLEAICDHVAIIDRGRVVAAGDPRSLHRRADGTRTVRVRLADGAERTVSVEDQAAQRALLRYLVVERELPVIEFSRTVGGLEELFLHLTEDGDADDAARADDTLSSFLAKAPRRRWPLWRRR